MRTPFALVAAALLAGTAAAQSAAPFIVQEQGRGYSSLQDAVDSIGGGSGTILIAPGTYRECAVQDEGRVAYVAREPGTVVFDGGICEAKAALVLGDRKSVGSGKSVSVRVDLGGGR